MFRTPNEIRYRNTILPRGAVTRKSPPSSIEQLVGELAEGAARLLESSSPPGSRGVQAPPSALHDFRARAQETFALHAVQRGVQGAGTDSMTVSGELFRDPGPVDFALGSMVEHVQLHSTAVE